jgi:hypothetical protein
MASGKAGTNMRTRTMPRRAGRSSISAGVACHPAASRAAWQKGEKMRKKQFLMTLLAALAASGAVQAQTIYKFIGPDGVVEYSSSPPPAGTKVLTEIESKTLTPAQRDAVERQRMANAAKTAAANALVNAHIKRMKDADAAILAAQQELQRAEQALQDGRDSAGGDRIGTAGGHARLTDDYFQRITALEQAVTDARQRLDQAYLARNNL